ncbi:MAG: helix-turn-helix domain-containing protein [Pseudomonadota bacterium]
MNNLQAARISLRMSREAFARRLGIYPDYLADLEISDRTLPGVWAEALERGFDFEPVIMDDPLFDGVQRPRGPLPPAPAFACPIAIRFALQTLIAYIAGVNRTVSLSEDQFADAVVGLNAYYADGAEDAETTEERINRLSKGLQITVLTIVQSCEIVVESGFEKTLALALPPLAQMIEACSQTVVSDPETK